MGTDMHLLEAVHSQQLLIILHSIPKVNSTKHVNGHCKQDNENGGEYHRLVKYQNFLHSNLKFQERF